MWLKKPSWLDGGHGAALASRNQGRVPKAMLAVLDKPAVQWVCEEAAQSGAREILLVVSPDGAVQKHFSKDEALERTLAVQNRLNELAAVSAIARLNVEFAVQQNAGGSEKLCFARAISSGTSPFFCSTATTSF